MPPKVKNYLIVLLALATSASGLVAWQQNQRLHSLEEALLKASAPVKPKAAPVAATFTHPSETAAPAEPAAEAPAPDAQSTAQRQRNNQRPNMAALMANPEFAKAFTLQQRAALDGRYADLFKRLNLTPAELENVKTLLIERQSAAMDVMATAREQGLDPRNNRDELRKLTADAQAEVDANLKASLGDSRYTQYQSYESTQAQRAVVTQLDQRLSYSTTPLTSAQSDFLVSALSTGSNTTTSNIPGAPAGYGGGNRTVITDAVIQQAQSVLSSDQVAALKQIQVEQQAQQQINQLVRAGNNGGAAGGGNNKGTRQPAK